MVVLKFIGVVLAIILAILVLFGFAAMVCVAFLLIDKQETEEINNKTSE
jgi:ABC-type transport system involved in multi-copper enzyme maturation permease subunit